MGLGKEAPAGEIPNWPSSANVGRADLCVSCWWSPCEYPPPPPRQMPAALCRLFLKMLPGTLWQRSEKEGHCGGLTSTGGSRAGLTGADAPPEPEAQVGKPEELRLDGDVPLATILPDSGSADKVGGLGKKLEALAAFLPSWEVTNRPGLKESL